MSESPELLPVTEKKSSCGCHEHSDERLTLDARAIPHRLRHAAGQRPAESVRLHGPTVSNSAANPRTRIDKHRQKLHGRHGSASSMNSR